MNKIGKESLLNDMMYSLTQIPMKHGVSSPLPGALSSQKMQPSVSRWMALTMLELVQQAEGCLKAVAPSQRVLYRFRWQRYAFQDFGMT